MIIKIEIGNLTGEIEKNQVIAARNEGEEMTKMKMDLCRKKKRIRKRKEEVDIKMTMMT